jgi:hypothetical protein
LKNHRAEILSLQALIESERKATKNQTVSYSKEIKREVVALFHRLQSQSKVARELNIPQTTISRWVRESATRVVSPRKLVVVETKKLEAVEPVTHDILHFDAVLPNGILLKGLRFDASSLQLLRGAL